MFIEEKKSWKYLAKKSFWKKFLVKLDENLIAESLIKKITEKECEHIFNSLNYSNFEKEVFNKETLKKIVFKSKLINNNINILELKNFDLEKGLNKKWNFYKAFIEKKFPLQFIFNSNNIEWSKIPEEEVEKVILKWKSNYKIKNEIQEVKNSHKSWIFLNENFIFNESNIKKLYHILTKNLYREWNTKYPRGFKKVPVVINNEETTSPENVSNEIKTLIKNYKEDRKVKFPLQNAFDFHLKYEQIHPFEDWNWRTWRFFMNKILMQNWYLPMIVFKENKSSYFSSISSCKSRNKKNIISLWLNSIAKL